MAEPVAVVADCVLQRSIISHQGSDARNNPNAAPRPEGRSARVNSQPVRMRTLYANSLAAGFAK